MSQAASPIRIAVVDDDKALLSVFSAIMKRYGYWADFFSGPVRALYEISTRRGVYRLVLTDLRMPEMDGLEFARQLRETEPDMPVIFMTGEVTDEAKEAAEKMGRTAFVEKPFPLEQTLSEFIPKFLDEKSGDSEWKG